MTTRKRTVFLVIITLIVFCTGWLVWDKTASPTRVALLNFQPFQTTSIVAANADPSVKYEVLTTDDLSKINRYDFVLGFGMGLQITADQRQKLQQAADKGLPIYIYAATNPENNLCNLDSIQKSGVSDYLGNGNTRNYRSLARFIRKNIDKKTFFVNPPDSVVKSASDVLYDLDEEVWFDTVEEYEAYLHQKGLYHPGGAKVAIVGGLNDPFSGNRDNIDSLIVSLRNSGLNVYPVSSMMKRLDFLRRIDPDLVIYFAHGRLAMGGGADRAVEWLKSRNIPVFSPLSILQTEKEWMNDPMGMFGGFMSQSVVVPELDGAIYPYVLNAQEKDENGLYRFKAIPDRLHSFTRLLNRFVALKRKANSEKKIAIYYFKGAGQETLTAQGLETVPSLYNLLLRLQREGYRIDRLPASEREFERLLMSQGAVLSTYAEGAFDEYLKNGNPALVERSRYESWAGQALPESLYADVVELYGEAPGRYMSVRSGDSSYLAVARIELGNIVLLPQPMAGLGDDEFAITHGTRSAPPHTYIAAYLWSQYEFGADALLHFGTHGSLEFTPSKQVALSSNDWPDRLVGDVPHFYYYTIGNIGESMMAKRRSYATLVSYLTPPFMESNTRSQFRELQQRIRDYYTTEETRQEKASLEVKKVAVAMGLHRELCLDSTLSRPFTLQEIEKIENFSEEIASEKMTGELYTTGVSYDPQKIRSTVMAMSVDPVAYSLSALDRMKGKVTDQQLKSKSFFNRMYLEPAKSLVAGILAGQRVDENLVRQVTALTPHQWAETREILTPSARPAAMAASRQQGESQPAGAAASNDSLIESGGYPGGATPATGHPGGRPGADSGVHPSASPSSGAATPAEPKTYSKEQKELARAVSEVERTLYNVLAYRQALQNSPELEMQGLLNALSGGYIAPSSGGDAVANPLAVPTGRNLYAVNAEATPSEAAWDKGISLVNATLEQYRARHGQYPRKVSYTFWSSEFIETEGATIAQVLYMLGVEPVRDAFGRVSDLRLVPSESLGRPRIDVVVQTSGQFRDLAASRLALISRAVEMASASPSDVHGNYVNESSIEIERQLVDQGIPPKDARDLSIRRVFGGVNGMYGTGIQGMVRSGDKWEDESEIAHTYLQNMGAVYGGDKQWGEFQSGLLQAVLHNTDIVVQPRQSNTWGALSLDHVFEFMGGLNLAVRNVTGKDPEAYFADYRNRHNVRMQELKEAIGVESRSTFFNPEYIKEVMKGKASSAAQITELVTNTFGWNVMKPDVIDGQMWDEIYKVYVKDSHGLGVQNFFRRENPAAMQEITAVMMETARKGMWAATENQLKDIAELHNALVKEFGPSGAGFAGNNVKLQDFIAAQLSQTDAAAFREQIRRTNVAESGTVSQEGMVLRKEELGAEEGHRTTLNGVWIVSLVGVVFVALVLLARRKRKNGME